MSDETKALLQTIQKRIDTIYTRNEAILNYLNKGTPIPKELLRS